MLDHAASSTRFGPYFIWMYPNLNTWIQGFNRTACTWDGPSVNLLSIDLQHANFEVLIRRYREVCGVIPEMTPGMAHQYGQLLGGDRSMISCEIMDQLFTIDFLPQNATQGQREALHPSFLQGIEAIRTSQATDPDW